MIKKSGFTLIEVMVSVMIISVVIAALLELNANNSHLFIRIKNELSSQKYLTLLTSSSYGFENDSLTLDRLVEGFDLDDDLRRELKNIKAKVIYQEVDKIDLSQGSDEDTASNLSLYIGKTILKLPSSSTSLLRIKLQ